jgi:hypothetical protein
MVQELLMLLHFQIVVAADRKCRAMDTKVMQVALVL